MNVSNVLKRLAFGCMLSAICTSVQATAYYGDDCCPTNCCPTTCCPTQQCCKQACCCDGPLTCNAFGIAVKGGVTPSWFTDRGHVLFNDVVFVPVNSTIVPFPVVFQGPKEPDFDKFFDLPWQVGAEIQWNASCNVQFFAEYVFLNAKGKRHHFLFDEDLFTFRSRNRDFETNSVYVGARYYFGNVWCSECGTSSIAPFIGLKGGVVWHERTKSRNHFVFDDFEFDLLQHDVFRNQTLISAGVQIGLDYSINCNWGVVLTVEAVGTQGLRNNRNIPLPLPQVLVPGGPVVSFPGSISRGETGHILSVPVTLGVRYTF